MHLCNLIPEKNLSIPYKNKKIEKESRFLPKCASNLFNNIQKRLTKNVNTHNLLRCKGVPLDICRKGSYTVEAAVIIPLFMGFMVSLLFFFRVMQVETKVQEALTYASRMTAVEACAVENDGANLATSEVLFRKEMGNSPVTQKFVRGGVSGISLLSSDFEGEFVELKAKYTLKLPIGFFGVQGINISQTSCSRKWVGKDINANSDAPYVYVTETGTVYHTTASCRYLDLTIHAQDYATIGEKRNLGGAKYYPCSCVAEKISGHATVYITDYGTNYHSSLSCHGLKRTVKMVRLSEVGGKGACSKCGK